MLDRDVVVEQRFADRGARWRFDARAFRAVLGMRQDGYDGEGGRPISDFVVAAPGQRLADAAVHALGRKGLGTLGQRLDGGVDRARVAALRKAQRLQNGTRLRLYLHEGRMVGGVVMGDQALSRPVHRLVRSGMDISPIVPALLSPGARLDQLIMEFSPQYAIPA